MATLRTFIAIPLPESLLKKLEEVQDELKQQVFDTRAVKWVSGEGIHLTLKFLGKTREKQLPELKRALTAVAHHAPACTFTAEGLGCFPSPNRPRVLWVGVKEPTGRLAALQDAIEEVTEPLGYERERRGFTPHLTIGRVRRRASRDAKEQICKVLNRTEVGVLEEVRIDRFALIKSDLKPTGAEYTILETFELEEGGQ